MSDKKFNFIVILILIVSIFIVSILSIAFSTIILFKKPEPQVINTYDSELVEMSISYKNDDYTVDIEKYNKHFVVPYTDTKIIVYYETKAIVEEYDNGTAKIYFYIGVD